MSRLCGECGKGLALFKCKTNPKASEYYCADCHKSYSVTEQEAMYIEAESKAQHKDKTRR